MIVDSAVYRKGERVQVEAAPALGQPQKDPTHTANFGVKLQEKLKSVGVECELVYPGAPEVKHPTIEEYLIEKLKTWRRTLCSPSVD